MAFGQAGQGIFPTTVHGQLTDSYGLPTYTSSVNPFSNLAQTGLILGQGWLLFDFTIVNLIKAAGAVAANASCTFQAGNSNFYNVIQALSVTSPGLVPVTAINDRGGALATGGINWMTTFGVATANVAGGLTASSLVGGTPLVSSTTVSGQLAAASVTVSYYSKVLLLNTTSVAGNYPVLMS